ncbi:hypothetical protein F66182_5423 [Fusarium sp. NRRL 66182]|nr:hypothetical protein F66182_5423 [Fusarium sp. NRRL 66182]
MHSASTASVMHPIGVHRDVAVASLSQNALESSQNAISTLLQPLMVRTGPSASSLHATPTARDIPPVPLTNIQRVDAADFEPYLSQIGPLYAQLQRLKDSEDEARGVTKSGDFIQDDGYLRQTGSLSSSARKRSVPSLVSPTVSKVDLSDSPKGHYSLPPLSIVPELYFDQDFQLENPRTFHAVSEQSEVVPSASMTRDAGHETPAGPKKTLATNAILQEKISWYMDTVEAHLINSISMASTAFFSALGSLRELHLEAAESVEKMASLRKDLELLDKDVVRRGVTLSRKRQARRNLQQIHDAVLQLKCVVERVAHCEALVDQGEVEEALAEIDVIEPLMAGERHERLEDQVLAHVQLRDIRGATALQGAVNDLISLRSRIGKSLESKVHTLLIKDLRRHVQSVSTQDVLQRWEAASLRAKGAYKRQSSASPCYMSQTNELRKALLPSIDGLYRSGSTSTAVQAYRRLVLQEIRNLVRDPLPSADADTDSITSASTMSGGRGRTNQEKSSGLAQNLRALDPGDAEQLFSTIFITVAETLRRLKTQSGILLEIACAIGPDAEDPIKPAAVRSPLASPNPTGDASMFELQEEMHIALDLPNLLGQAVDASHEKINKILRVRSAQATDLPLAYFLRYYALNLFFANECEAISGRAGTSFKTIVNGHIQDFIKAHGDKEDQALANGMGADTWQDKDFTAKDDEILNQILQCSALDVPAWTKTGPLWVPLSQDEAEEVHGTEENIAKDKVRGATIDGETFLLPSSAILCLEGVSRFLRLICGIPSMTPAVAASLLSYLQLYDSRCRQLILGAGALRSAGLKNVTTAHLALASRALSFMSTIMPYIREFVRRHAPGGPVSANLMGDFDKVRLAFQDHQNSIYEKLIDMMVSRARLLSKEARDIDWDKEKVEDVRKYMANLIRDTGRLHKALSKRLPGDSFRPVMVSIFASYKHHLGTTFREIELETDTGRKCMLYDVDHLIHKLGKVEGFGDLGTCLTDIIKSKDI